MITAENTSEMVMSALEYQPDSYLTKPFNAQILKSRLDKCIKKKQAVSKIIQFMQSKNWPEALQECDETIKNFPKYRMACLKKKFHCLKALKKYSEALDLATTTFNEKPIPWAMLGIGEIFYNQQDYEQAMEVFSNVIKEFPMILSAYDWLAKTQYLLGETIEAQKTIIQALNRSPKILERQMLLGELSEKNDDLDVMIQAYRQAIKFGENSAFSSPKEFIKLTKSIAVQLHRQPNTNRDSLIKEAEETFDKLDERFKGVSEVQLRSTVAHAEFCDKTGNKNKTPNYLKMAENIYQKNEELIDSEASIEICSTLKELGKQPLAEKILEDGVQQHFQNKNFMNAVAKITTQKKLISNAKIVNELNNKALSYFSKKDYGSALTYFAQASQIMPENINITLNYTQSLLKEYQLKRQDRKLIDKAKKLLSSINKLSFKDPRYAKYIELSRLIQLMLQKDKGV